MIGMYRRRNTMLFLAVAVTLLTSCGGSGDSKSVDHDSVGNDAFSTSLVADDVIASVTVDPARAGKAVIHAEFTPPGGSLQQVTSLVGNLIPSDPALSTIILWFEKDGSNHFHFEVSVPSPGEWTLEFDATLEDGTTALFTTPVSFAA